MNRGSTAPGARYASAVDMSRQAVFTDAGASIDPTNAGQHLPQLLLPRRRPGPGPRPAAAPATLPHQPRPVHAGAVAAVWESRPTTRRPAPTPLPDLQRVLGEVSRDTAFAGRFFRQYVYGPRASPLRRGACWQRAWPWCPATLGAALAPSRWAFDHEGRCLVAGNALIGSGLYKAGIDRGDQLVMLDDKAAAAAPADLLTRAQRHAPNDIVMAQACSPRRRRAHRCSWCSTKSPTCRSSRVETVRKRPSRLPSRKPCATPGWPARRTVSVPRRVDFWRPAPRASVLLVRIPCYGSLFRT
ncbi:MAG: hypothetical protein WKG07_33845 [Hymenobacter sp.]